MPRPSPSYSNAFMSIRSITPRTSCSEPIGISVATTWGPKASLSESSARKKSARSRSSMLTNTSRARPSSSARLQRRSVWTSTPITALTTTTAASTTRRAPSVSATKLGSPGVSIRLILRSVVLERGDAGADRHLALLLVGLEVGDGRAVLDPAEPVDHPGLEQERLAEARLAAAPVPDQGDVADPVGWLVRHADAIYAAACGRSTVRPLGEARAQRRARPWCGAGRRATR